MIKFGMSELEVNQNAPMVVLGNFMVYGMVLGAVCAIALGGIVYVLAKVLF